MLSQFPSSRVVLSPGWFCPQETLGNIWRQFFLSWLEGGMCYWGLVDTGQRCCEISYIHTIESPTHHYPPQMPILPLLRKGSPMRAGTSPIFFTPLSTGPSMVGGRVGTHLTFVEWDGDMKEKEKCLRRGNTAGSWITSFRSIPFHYNIDEKKDRFPAGPLSVWRCTFLPRSAWVSLGPLVSSLIPGMCMWG